MEQPPCWEFLRDRMLITEVPVKGVFFDVDFTLIYPGSTFQAEGYIQFCTRHGIEVDKGLFDQAVIEAAPILDASSSLVYDEDIFTRYTTVIIEAMGGTGKSVNACAREISKAWAVNRHFYLYKDVRPILETLSRRGIKVGLISNSDRCLLSFQSHFKLNDLIAGTVSSAEHGYLKPHPSIFRAALQAVGVKPEESIMVGDSLTQDIEGARGVGMGGVLVRRTINRGVTPILPESVLVIHTLSELEQFI